MMNLSSNGEISVDMISNELFENISFALHVEKSICRNLNLVMERI